MNKKYVYTDSNITVKVNDIVQLLITNDKGDTVTKTLHLKSSDDFEYLFKNKIITEVPFFDKEKSGTRSTKKKLPTQDEKVQAILDSMETDVNKYINDMYEHIIRVNKITPDEGITMVNAWIKFSPQTIYLAIAKEIAVQMDRNYLNHISECDTLYTISIKDFGVYRTKPSDLKYIGTFGLFRSCEEAIAAAKILKPIRDIIVQKQKNAKGK